MKKTMLSLALVLLAAITQAQPYRDSIPITYTIYLPPGGTRYFGSGEVERTITWFPANTPFLSVSDSMRVILLLAEAQAIILDNVAEQVLLQVLHNHFLEPDFYQNYFLEAFPATLDLHIQRKSPYAIAARGLKQRYFPEKK